MAQKQPNPFHPDTDKGRLYEMLSDQQWHSAIDIKAKILIPKVDPVLNIIRERGIRPEPKYPFGMWNVTRNKGMIQLRFTEPMAENAGVDEEKVQEMVQDVVKTKVDEIVKTSVEVYTEEHMKLVKLQLEEIRKSSVPILELVRFEGPKKLAKTIQPAHNMMVTLLYLMSLGEHVYLHDPTDGSGGPGSGKTTAAIMAAEAMGKRWGYISLTPTTFESRIFGYHDAHGKYHTTDFRECYEKGGRMIIDEGDNGSGNLYTAINGALENAVCSFPDKIVKRHPDFSVVMTGNTSGGGPNPMFPTRRPFDKAFAERFVFLPWGYDTQLELTIAKSINEYVAPVWHEYMLRLRDWCKKHQPTTLVSPRATFKGCKFMKDGVISFELLMHATIFKGLENGICWKILAANPIPVDELNEACEEYKKNGGKPHVVKSARAAKVGTAKPKKGSK